ncbi:MAG: MFS transporter [Nanoarchaeales archaeon]|nr:MFS transporter [Nanoarchaeales archaeon]
MLNKLKSNPVVMFFTSFQLMYQFSLGVVVPFWSIILLNAGWETLEITYFFAISAFVVFLFGGVVGKFADYIGKKKMILTGLIIQASFFILYFFFIQNSTVILIARVFEIFAFMLIGMVGLSALEDYLEDSNRGFWTGIFLGVGAIGMLIGPIIAGYIAEVNLPKVLLLVSAVITVLSIFVLNKIPMKHNKVKHSFNYSDLNPLSEVKRFLSFKKLRGMAILGILMNSKAQIYAIFFPIFVIETLNLPIYYVGYLYSIPVFFHLFQAIFGKYFDKVSTEMGVLIGVSLSSGAMFMFPYINNLWQLVILLCVFGLGSSIWNVTAWSLMGTIAKKNEMEGEINGTYMSIAKLGVFVTTLFSAGIIATFGIERTLQLMAIMIFVGVGICYFMFQPIFHGKLKKSNFDLIKN